MFEKKYFFISRAFNLHLMYEMDQGIQEWIK